jgi:GntR family transcriptional regulator/MocR family aminotransferase
MDLQLTLGPGPLRSQLEHELRERVRAGRLRPGTRLPASRVLAQDLGVARGTVAEAYAQLVAEGYLVARRGAGTLVAGTAGGAVAAPAPAAPARVRFDLRTGRPDLGAFPRGAYRAAIGQALRELPDAALDYGDPRGHAPLRAALAAQLGRTRGVVADPEHLVITAGTAQGLQLVWRALARRAGDVASGGASPGGDGAGAPRAPLRVAIEDPGWSEQRAGVRAAGLEPVPVAVDDRGADVAAIARAGCAAAVLTPAHQFPTGGVLAPERRAALLDWARARGAVVVEDDYDAEYRYDRDPIGALQGLAPASVVYAGSASKTLAPGLRIGWLVLPERLVADVARERWALDRGSPVLEQAALALLLASGVVDRHLRRTRRRHRARREALVAALARHLPGAPISGVAAGLYLGVELPAGADDVALAAAARAAGIALHAVHEDCTVVAPHPPALLLGYGALPESAAEPAVAALASVLRSGSPAA